MNLKCNFSFMTRRARQLLTLSSHNTFYEVQSESNISFKSVSITCIQDRNNFKGAYKINFSNKILCSYQY